MSGPFASLTVSLATAGAGLTYKLFPIFSVDQCVERKPITLIPSHFDEFREG